MKFSIVTVCYNAGDVIERTLQSVLSQRYNNIEYIVIDGASKDGTMDILKQYSNKIDVLISEPDSGVYDAMNKGIANASGEYINFMNAGDIFVDDAVLRNLAARIDSRDYDVIFGDEIKCYKWGDVLRKSEYFSDHSVGMPFGHQSTFVKTSLMKKMPFDTTFRILADQNCIYSLYKQKKTFLYVDLPIAKYDMYGLSNNVSLIYKENARIKGITGFRYYWGLCKSQVKQSIYGCIPQSLLYFMQQKKYRRNII